MSPPNSRTRGASEAPPDLRVVLDFDGTLVDPNVAILLVSEFAPNGDAVAHEVDQLLHSGQIGLREAWHRQAALLPGNRIPEMARFVRARVPLRRGARQFLELAQGHHVPVTIVSGGLDFYIREVLDREGLDLPIRSDRLEVRPDGTPQVVHPYAHPSCERCGICKAAIVIDRVPPARTVFIADGSTDRFGAEASDIVFARHRLLDYCRRAGIACYPFEDFAPVTEQFRRWLVDREPLPPVRPLGLATSVCPISLDLSARAAVSET